MTEQYLPVLLLFGFATFVVAVILLLNAWLGPKAKDRKDYASKYTPFECGSDLWQDSNRRVSLRYYLIALLFVLFDLEVILLYPWAVVARKLGPIAYIEIAIFLFFLLLALIYVYRRKAVEWR